MVKLPLTSLDEYDTQEMEAIHNTTALVISNVKTKSVYRPSMCIIHNHYGNQINLPQKTPNKVLKMSRNSTLLHNKVSFSTSLVFILTQEVILQKMPSKY